MSKKYEMVIGLEVHVELKTVSKIFCACQVEYGAGPNTNTCPICLGLPGALPTLNEKVVEYALKAGIATNSKITEYGRQDRKNYFYPDSPKAYQISQDELPLCYGGHVDIEIEDSEKRIGLTRIHIEEDAGKLLHDSDLGTLIDYNRAGVPLIEIVTDPDFRSEEEVITFLQKLRSVLIYIGVSDCKMNEGSFRCDVNLSIKEKGSEKLGTRTEIKNLNSFNSISRAIGYEKKRQIRLIEKGQSIRQETLSYDDEKRVTYSMREKEDAGDYRYFPDPDLMPIVVDKDTLKRIKEGLPELPESRKKTYIEKYDLRSYDAEQIVSSIDRANYFEECVKLVDDPKLLANVLIGEVFHLTSGDSFDVKITPQDLGEVIEILQDESISYSSAKELIRLINKTGKKARILVEEEGLGQISDRAFLEELIETVILENKKAVEEYRSGKEKAMDALIGKVMKETKGRANPERSRNILKEKIKVE